MKTRNFLLRKVLLALVVVAMLASLIVTAVIAADTYGGKLSDAQALLDKVAEAESTADKSKALAAVYAYATNANTLLDPSEDGYDEFVENYNALSVQCGVLLYDAVKAASSNDAKSTALAAVYTHFAGAGMLDKKDPTTVFEDRYICKLCGQIYTLKSGTAWSDIDDSFICASAKCAGGKDDYTPHSVKYSEFVKEYESVSLDITNALIENLYTAITFDSSDPNKMISIGYYDYLILQNALRNYLDNILELDYKAPVNEAYTGTLAEAEALLALVRSGLELDAYETALGNVYDYLVATPVDPTGDAYATFIEKYFAACDTLGDKICEAVDGADGIDGKIAALTDAKTYLSAKPVSEAVVAVFNAKVAELKQEYGDASSNLEKPELVIDKETLITPVVYNGTVEAWGALVDAIAATDDVDGISEFKAAVKAAYDYMIATPVDPSDDGYADVLADYTEKRDALGALLVAAFDAEEAPADKLAVLTANRDYLAVTPLSEAILDKHNEMVAAYSADLGEALALLGAADMTITAPVTVAPEANISYEMFTLLADAVKSAATLEAKKEAVTSLYRYVTMSEIEIGGANYTNIVNEYNTVTEALTEALIAEIEADAANIDAVRAYLAATPYSKAAVNAYNEKVTEESKKLTEVLIDIDAFSKTLNDETDIDALMTCAAKLYKFEQTAKYNVVDSAYDATMSDRADALTAFETKLMAYVDAQLDRNDKYAALVKARDFILATPITTTLFNKYNAKLAETAAAYTANKNSADASAMKLTSVIGTLTDMLGDVTGAEDLAAKKIAFKALFNEMNSSVIDQTDSAEFVAAYEAACADFIDELIASVDVPTPSGKVDALADVAAFVKEAPFSGALVDAYNAKYAEVKAASYSEAVEKLNTAFASNFVYTANSALVSDFTDASALVDALNGSKEGLVALYEYLAVTKLDIGSAKYAEIIAAYNADKADVSDTLCAAIDVVGTDAVAALKAGTINDKIAQHVAAFSEMRAFLTEYCISASMVEAYNAKRLSVASATNSYADMHKVARKLYSANVAKLHNHVDACPVSVQGVGKVAYDKIQNTLDAFEYAETMGLISAFETEAGDSATPVSTANKMFSQLNSYIKKYPIAAGYAGYKSFIQLYNDACEKLIVQLCAGVDSAVATEDKIAAFKSIEEYLTANPHNIEAVTIYNEKLAAVIEEYDDVAKLVADENDLVATGPDGLIKEPTYTEGAVAALGELLTAYEAAEGLEAQKTAFAAVYAYITTHNINRNEAGYDAFVAAYDDARDELAAALFATIDTATTSQAKLDAFIPIRDYLNVTPIEQSVVNAYNQKLDSFISSYTSYKGEITKGNIAFAPIVPPKYYRDNTIGGFGTAVNAVDAAVNVAEGTAIDKDAAITAIKKVHDLLRNENTTPDPTHASYPGIMSKYSAALDKFTQALKDDFNANKDDLDSAIDAIFELKEYLAVCVYSEDIVNFYNISSTYVSNMLTTFIDAGSAPTMKVVSPFGQLEDLMEAIDSTLSLNKLKRAFAEFYTYYKSVILDITDPAYTEFLSSFDNNANVIVSRLYSDFDSAKNPTDKYNALVSAKEYIIENPINAAIITGYNAKLADFKALDYAAVKTEFETECAAVTYYNGNAAGLNAILAGLESAADNTAKKDIVKNAFEYIKTHRLDTNETGYSEAYSDYNHALETLVDALIADAAAKADPTERAAAIADVRAYIEESFFSATVCEKFNTAFADETPIEYYSTGVDALFAALGKITSTTDKKALLATVRELIAASRVSASEWNASVINAHANEIKIDVAKINEDAKKKLDEQAPLDQYEITVPGLNVDFNDGVMPWTYNWASSNPNAKAGVQNGYMSFVHGGPPTGTSTFIDVRMPDTTNGLVFEFDITTHDHDQISQLNFSFVEYGLVTNARISTKLFDVLNNDIRNGSSQVVLEDAFTPGEWTHMILVYHADTFSVDMYANYEHVASYNLKTSTGEAVEYTTTRISIGATYCSASFDNFVAYEGTAFRILDKFKKMSDSEKFNYYVDYFTNENNNSTNRNQAYQFAKALLTSVANDPACAENFALFEDYDYDKEILGAAREQNLQTLVGMYNSIGEITTQNTSSQLALVESIEDFIGNNIQFLDQTKDEYKAVVNGVKDMRNVITQMSNAKNLVDALSRFKRATTLASMTRHMTSAISYYEACEFNVPGKYDMVKDDETVVAFLESVGAATLMEYYDSMPVIVAAETKRVNAQRIIDCIALIEGMEGYDPSAGVDAKEKFWNDNYEAIDKYLVIIRGVFGNYDESYKGVDAAIEVYNDINAYFFEILQTEHIKVITEQLDKYSKTSSYIEKRGICAFIDKYKEDNDIDYTLTEVKNLLAIHEVYKAEVEQYKEQYQTLLDQNTITFIAIVDRMDANSIDYAALKALYDEANREYYYNMNVDSEDADLKAKIDAAIVRFEAYGAQLGDIELATEKFLASAKILKNAKNRKQTYTALVGCAETIGLANVDAGTGVEAAIELYNTTLASYNASILPANALVSDANDIVSSSRSISIADTVLSIIKNIFSK